MSKGISAVASVGRDEFTGVVVVVVVKCFLMKNSGGTLQSLGTHGWGRGSGDQEEEESQLKKWDKKCIQNRGRAAVSSFTRHFPNCSSSNLC